MKIAFYVPRWPRGISANGIVTYASNLVPALRDLGHEVFVVTMQAEREDPHTIDLRRYWPRVGRWRRLMWKLDPSTASFNAASSALAAAMQDLHQRRNVEVLEIEESFGWSAAVSRLNLLPVVVRLHGPWFLTGRFNDPASQLPEYRRRAEFEGAGIGSAHYVTANCAETLDSVRSHYGLALRNSRIIPTPINAGEEAQTWAAVNRSSDSFLFVGRFDTLKGGDLVLRAFARLAERNPRLKLTFAGPDRGIKAADGKVLNFEEFVRQNFPESIRAQIDYRGRMDHADLMAVRAKHFATISAAQYDTMGYMILEALSLGCPLVTTAVGGIPEFVKDRRNGLLVPSQDVEAMTRACQALLDDPALAARIGRQAWQDCRDLYGTENVARQTVAGYEEAIAAFRAAGATASGSRELAGQPQSRASR
jgi:glycosyltransferase involved in cell wall biosynthesis